MRKVLAVIFFIAGLSAIQIVIEEILELDTVSTTLRYVDIVTKASVAGFSISAAYGLWKSKKWAFNIGLIAVAFNIISRALLFFAPHLMSVERISKNITGIVLYTIIGVYLYTQNKSQAKDS